MIKKRRRFSAAEKAKIALEAIKGVNTISEIAQRFEVHPTQVNTWRRELIERVPELFGDKQDSLVAQDQSRLIDELYKQIGQLMVERDWLKKKLSKSVEAKRKMIDWDRKDLSVYQQCELLGLARSSLYYDPQPVDEETLLLMHLVDEEYTRHPFYGTRKMTAYLRGLGYLVNRKRLQRYYGLLGLEAIYPKPSISRRDKAHAIYPYLLRDVVIERVDQVWSTDITYIRLQHGFAYLVAIIDWFSRYVLGWKLSVSLEADFCIDTLNQVLSTGVCEIFNTDQGAQFTTPQFTNLLIARGIQVSMDGKGRSIDNIFVERLWRSVKYELIYLHDYQTVREVEQAIYEYFMFYNHERPHQSLRYQTPASIYYKEKNSSTSESSSVLSVQ